MNVAFCWIYCQVFSANVRMNKRHCCYRLVSCAQIGHIVICSLILTSVDSSAMKIKQSPLLQFVNIDFRIWFAARSSSSFWIVGDLHVALFWLVAMWSRNTVLCIMIAYWVIYIEVAILLNVVLYWHVFKDFSDEVSVFLDFSTRCLLNWSLTFNFNVYLPKSIPSRNTIKRVSEWCLEITFTILVPSLVPIFNVESLSNSSQ